MGNHTIISVSHDTYREDHISWVSFLSQWVRSGSKDVADRLEQATGGAIKVVAMRHHSEPFYVGKDVEGFPTQLPYDDQLDADNAAWDAAQTQARAYLGKSLKLRTVSQLRELIVRLVTKHKTADASILAADGAFFARRKLENTSWQPTRADYEGLKNRLAKIEQVLGEVQ